MLKDALYAEIQSRYLCNTLNDLPLLGRGEAHTGVWWGNTRKSDHLEYLDVDVTII
jgi:hypothetical protein